MSRKSAAYCKILKERDSALHKLSIAVEVLEQLKDGKWSNAVTWGMVARDAIDRITPPSSLPPQQP